MRCRTREVGPTENDPELSCQYHYGGWMPYIVTNLDELLQHVRGLAPQSEIVVYRNHMILGGKQVYQRIAFLLKLELQKPPLACS